MKIHFAFPTFAAGLVSIAMLLSSGCGAGNSSTSATSTTTTLTASSTSTTTGTSITLTATVSPSAATGTVTFYSGSTSLGSASLSSGTATLTTSFSSSGTYSITAKYGGSSSYDASTSSTVSITVSDSTASTTTTLSSSATTTTVGTSITLTATVSPSEATGTVTFYSGSTSLGSATLSSGTATLTTSFSTAGSYSLTATYGGSSSYASSTSSTVTETVDSSSSSSSGTSSTTSLSASPSTAYPGSLVVLTATVSPSAATGTVTFYSGSTELGTGTISSGTATFTTHFSSTGSYTLTASYGGDSTYASSSSSSVTETVESGSYSLDLSSYTPTTGSGTYNSHTVDYKLYSNVVYAADPVSTTYETMNIFVPTSVDGTSVSDMPILLEIGVGGYLSAAAGSTPGTNGQYAMGKGYVVVEVGCRGRDNGSSGNYYGVAPAAIVDLKAAVRYLRYNYTEGTFTGDVSHIIDSGGSAGGALASLLGASGNSTLYDSYLAALGAADADDNIFAVGAWSPITNLDHADGAYEEEYSSLEYSGSTVNSTVSSALISEFETYQNDLELTDKRGSLGTLTSSNITEYILEEYMEPSLEKYVESNGTSSAPSYATCAASSSSTYGYTCTFTFANYVANSIGTRGKSAPAFDAFFDITSSSSYYDTVVNTSCPAEALEFGNPSGTASTYSGTNCSTGSPRHFTDYTSEAMDDTDISSSMQTLVDMMNPMYFITNAISSGDTSGVAKYWYIRDGTIATDTSAYIIVDLATALENLRGTSYVNSWEDWGEGHNVETDPSGFSSWVTSSVASN
ncbi:subtype B tannase [Silvibacterium dinghuense]|nr:subtype B tannase [Silvibacterium dinghuense]